MSTHPALLFVLPLLVACGADSDSKTPDAAAPPRVMLYLAFDGVTLHPGAVADASTDTVPFVDHDVTLPPFLDGQADRQPRIDAIVDEIDARLAPFDIEIVRARPSVAPYFQLVFTSDASLIGVPAGVGSVAPFDCDQLQDHALGIQFTNTAAGDQYGPRVRANWALTTLGIAHHVPMTRLTHDCMCWVGSACNNADDVVCEIGGPGTPVETDYACPGSPATIDERVLLETALGRRD